MCVVCVCVCVCVCVSVFGGSPLCMPVRKSGWVFVCVPLYVCVGTTFVSMLGQCQVLMALLETQCECCVVSVTMYVCVCVCVCVCVKPSPCRRD